LPFDWGSRVESALRIFGADRALLLIEGVAIAKVVMLGIAYPFAAGGKSKTACTTSRELISALVALALSSLRFWYQERLYPVQKLPGF
jgi:hypothetical protein